MGQSKFKKVYIIIFIIIIEKKCVNGRRECELDIESLSIPTNLFGVKMIFTDT